VFNTVYTVDTLLCVLQATNEELGMWLERVLHAPNDCKGDSPKV
jgi:hypothetical protein